MLDKEAIRNLYIQGYKACEIAEILEENSTNIRKCINRNFKNDKVTHEINRIRDKEILRVTLHESKQFMSDSDFVKRNRSIYRTKENGDIVVKKEFKSILPFDVPRSLVNQDKCII